LNAGIQLTIWSRVVGWPQPMVAVGRCLELAASLVFVHLAWPRVKAFGA
jgi:hypothetical protein